MCSLDQLEAGPRVRPDSSRSLRRRSAHREDLSPEPVGSNQTGVKINLQKLPKVSARRSTRSTKYNLRPRPPSACSPSPSLQRGRSERVKPQRKILTTDWTRYRPQGNKTKEAEVSVGTPSSYGVDRSRKRVDHHG